MSNIKSFVSDIDRDYKNKKAFIKWSLKTYQSELNRVTKLLSKYNDCNIISTVANFEYPIGPSPNGFILNGQITTDVNVKKFAPGSWMEFKSELSKNNNYRMVVEYQLHKPGLITILIA